MKKIVGRIIELVGCLALLATYVLFYLSKKKMGVQRDFIFRNKKWMDLFFTEFAKYVFIAVVVLGIIYLGICLIKGRKQLSLWQFCHSILLIALASSFILLLANSVVIGFTGLPMLLVSLLIIIVGGIIGTSWQKN